MEWINLAQDRDRWVAVMNAVMDLWLTWHKGKFWTRQGYVRLSRRI